MNEAAVLQNLHFQWCILNVDKTDTVTYFSELICQSLLRCLEVCMSSDKYLLNYSYLF